MTAGLCQLQRLVGRRCLPSTRRRCHLSLLRFHKAHGFHNANGADSVPRSSRWSTLGRRSDSCRSLRSLERASRKLADPCWCSQGHYTRTRADTQRPQSSPYTRCLSGSVETPGQELRCRARDRRIARRHQRHRVFAPGLVQKWSKPSTNTRQAIRPSAPWV